MHYFSMQHDETVSDSLLDKFDNISGSSVANDRFIAKITIKKEVMDTNTFASSNNSDDSKCKRIKSKFRKSDVQNNSSANCRRQILAKDQQVQFRKQQFLSRSQESIFLRRSDDCSSSGRSSPALSVQRSHTPQKQNNSIDSGSAANETCSGLTLGISIVQGSDNNVYVKDLVKNGPGELGGIQIGDQVRIFFFILYIIFYLKTVPINLF